MGVQTWVFDAGSSNAGVRIWASTPGCLPLGYDSIGCTLRLPLQQFASGSGNLGVQSRSPIPGVRTWESELGCPILSPIPGVRLWESESESPVLAARFQGFELGTPNLGV